MTPARSAFAFLRYWPHVGSGKGLTTSVVEGVVSVISAVVPEVSGVTVVTVVSTSSLVLLISLVLAMTVDPAVVPTVVGAGVVGAGAVVVSGSGCMRSQPQDLSQ